MVEPLEDARTELTFVTEMVTSSLGGLLSAASGSSTSTGGSRRRDGQSRPPAAETSNEIDLDEVEIQKGTLQIARALTFLHQQAKLVHLNLSPEAILINAKVSSSRTSLTGSELELMITGRLEALWIINDYAPDSI